MKVFYKVLFFSFVLGSCLASCSSNKKEDKNTIEQMETEFRTSLSSSDSIRVLTLCDSVMTLIKENKLDEAISCFYDVDSLGNLTKLDDARVKQLQRKFTMFPVREFSLKTFYFNLADQNIVEYNVIFDDANSITSVGFSPVKYVSDWYITIRKASSGDGRNFVKPESSDSIQ